jgi:hypothetical protein
MPFLQLENRGNICFKFSDWISGSREKSAQSFSSVTDSGASVARSPRVCNRGEELGIIRKGVNRKERQVRGERLKRVLNGLRMLCRTDSFVGIRLL